MHIGLAWKKLTVVSCPTSTWFDHLLDLVEQSQPRPKSKGSTVRRLLAFFIFGQQRGKHHHRQRCKDTKLTEENENKKVKWATNTQRILKLWLHFLSSLSDTTNVLAPCKKTCQQSAHCFVCNLGTHTSIQSCEGSQLFRLLAIPLSEMSDWSPFLSVWQRSQVYSQSHKHLSSVTQSPAKHQHKN